LILHIEENLADEISLSSLAQLVPLSPFHFSRAFEQRSACHRIGMSLCVELTAAGD
jgi:transcriptional regulator GlxA family with amidase domain